MATTNSLNNASAPFTVTSGNLAVSAGNITLPTANSGLTNGVISWATSNLRIHDFGTDNIFIGAGAGNGTMTGTDNVFIGANGGSALTSGVGNMGIGANCLSAVQGGSSNVGMGIATLHSIVSNGGCTGVGHNALNAATGGANTAIGYQSLNQLTTGANNVAIGYQAGNNYTGSETNNLLLGYSVLGTAAESNVIRIGNSSHTSCYITGVASVAVANLNVVTINTVTGQLGSQTGGTGTVTSVSGTTNQVSVATGTTTPVISLTGPYTPATYTAHGVLIGESTSSIVATAAGSAGQVLQSGGASADPTWSTPTYPSASGTSRKIIVSDGTNNVYSTETWATPGTSGNVLTSDGTNWTSAAAPGGGLVLLNGTLTNSQIKNLHATPIQVVAAQGAGKLINVVNFTAKFIYGGTNAFTAAASQTISFYYGTALSIATAITNSDLAGTSSVYSKISASGGLTPSAALATVENVALNLYNDKATEISGNAANNNTISYSLVYRVISI